MRAPLAGALLAAALAAPCLAVPARASLTWDLSLGAGAEWNDNLFLAPERPPAGEAGPTKSTVLLGSPGLRLLWEEGRDSLRLDYQGVYQAFQDDADTPPVWVHEIDAALDWRRWRPFFLEVREKRAPVPQYRSSADAGQDLYANAERNTLEVRPGLAWDLGPTGSVEVALHAVSQTFPESEPAEEMTDLLGEVVHRRRWTPLWSTALLLRYGTEERTVGPDFRVTDAALDVSQRLAPRIAATYGLEWRQERCRGDETPGEGERPCRDDERFLKRAAITGELEHGGSWRVGYQDRIENLVTGDRFIAGRGSVDLLLRTRPGSRLGLGALYERREFLEIDQEEVVWSPNASARWVVLDWLALDLNGYWSRTRMRASAATEVVDKQLAFSAGLVLLLGRHVQLETGYRFLQDHSSDPTRSYEGNRVYALVTAFLRPFRPGVFPESLADQFTPYPVERVSNTPSQSKTMAQSRRGRTPVSVEGR